MAYLASPAHFLYSRSLDTFSFPVPSFERKGGKVCKRIASPSPRRPLSAISSLDAVSPLDTCPRRVIVLSTIGLLAGASQITTKDTLAVASEFADMPALRGKDYGKSKMRYPDYTETDTGLQYKAYRTYEMEMVLHQRQGRLLWLTGMVIP